MSIKERITARLEEQKKTVFDDLIAKGANDVTEAGMQRYERKFKLSLSPVEVDKILTKHKFRMVTHTVQGHPLEKYIMYTDDRFKGGNVTNHMKNGKIWYMVFDFRHNDYD